MGMTKEERKISAELSRQGYFVKDNSKPTNVLIIKQKVTTAGRIGGDVKWNFMEKN